MASGVTPVLGVALAAHHPVVWRAARELARAWSQVGGAQLRPIRVGSRFSGPRIRLDVGSLVRPSVVVAFDEPFAPEPAARAEQLALTTAAWDSLDDLEPWRALSAPLPGAARVGRPDMAASWVLIRSGAAVPASFRLESGTQLHVVGGLRPPPTGSVWWPSWPGVVAAVLGRADRVVGLSDPLVFDAVRAGVPLEPVGDEPATAGCALAGLVPPSLLGDPRLWLHVARTAREVHETGAAPAPLMTPEWVAAGRELIRQQQAAPPTGWARVRRRHDKLRRDPERFCADSRFRALRRLGRLMWRQ